MTLTLAIVENTSLFAAVAAVLFAFTSSPLGDWSDLPIALVQALTIAACCAVSFYYNDLYDFRIVRSLGVFAARLLQSLGLAFILLAALYGLAPAINIANDAFALCLLVSVPLLLTLRGISYGLMGRTPFVERVLILGTSPLAHKIVREIDNRPDLRHLIVGIAGDSIDGNVASLPYPLLGPLEHLDKIVRELKPDRLIVALAERRARLPVRQLLDARLNGTFVEEGVDAYERFTGKLAIESLTPSNLIFSGDFGKSRWKLAAGRLLNFGLAVTGVILAAPVMGVLAILIKLDSAGPVFFIQERMGMHGKRFRLIKFRTMRAADVHPSEWACDNTARITRVGKWLRKFRLDELPQLFNVIQGDMNFVGPRPHPVSNFELFVENIPFYSLRAVVRPGITGWAQVRYGYANNLDEEIEKMRYDLYYIKHLSAWFDLRILFDTVKTVMFGRGTPAVNGDGAGHRAAVNGR